jgi:hypothetical protein
VYYRKKAHLLHDLQHFHDFGQHIQRLSLTLWSGMNKKLETPIGFAPTIRMPKLKELSLEGLELGHLYEPLSRLIHFAALSHLSLVGSRYSGPFTSALVKSLRVTGLQLEHFATNICVEDEKADFGTHTAALFPIDPNIKSLHFSSGSYALLTNLLSVGPQLRVLSLDNCKLDQSWLEDNFASICDAFPNLEQLGWQLSEKPYGDCSHESRNVEVFLVCESMRKMRVL